MGGLVFSTKPYLPWEMIYYEDFNKRSEAMKREKELKSQKGREFIRKRLLSQTSWLKSVS